MCVHAASPYPTRRYSEPTLAVPSGSAVTVASSGGEAAGADAAAGSEGKVDPMAVDVTDQ